jgi:hypothetical protein
MAVSDLSKAQKIALSATTINTSDGECRTAVSAVMER